MILAHVAAVFYRNAMQHTGIPPGINRISEIKTEGGINVKLTNCNAFQGVTWPLALALVGKRKTEEDTRNKGRH